jgi:hypothetical protein
MYAIIPQQIPQGMRAEVNEKILFAIDSGKDLIPAESIYNCYTGIGGLHNLKQSDFANYHEYAEAKKESEMGQFFTPHEVCRDMADMLSPTSSEMILDMCCGMGNFFNHLPNLHNAYGFDIDGKAVSVARYLYPDAHIEKCDLRQYYPEQRFDIVIGNPPFNLKFDYKLSQEYYMDKAYDVLNPAGILMIIVPGSFMLFDLRYAPGCERFSFIVDKQDTKRKQVAILEGRERNTRQKALLEKEISRRPKLLTNIRDEVAGMRFCVTNIFVDNDILLFRFGLHNRSQIGYTMDFIRFYIQDAKKRKKTAVQQLEQQPLFSFNRPEEVAALSSCDFTVALPKFTIPDKKVLIIEIQERNGGRHFYYKLKNKQLINAEILFPEIVGKP